MTESDTRWKLLILLMALLSTLGVRADDVTKEVKRLSFTEIGKMQTPTITPSTVLNAAWKSMRLR